MSPFRADSLLIDSQQASVGGYRLLNNQPATNGDTVDLVPGMPVVVIGENTVVRASAAPGGLATVDGLIFTTAAPATNCVLRSQGRMTLEPGQWDVVTGHPGGLFPGALYYLGLEPGTLTTAPPFHDGEQVLLIGKAFSALSLIIEIGSPVLL